MPHRTLVPLLAFAACAVSVGFMIAGSGASATAGSVYVELDAPRDALPFRLQRLDGTVLDSRQLRGKIVVLDVWATWCGPCLTEIPGLNGLQTEYRTRGVEVIGVTVDSASAEAIRAVAAEHFPVSYTLTLGTEAFEDSYGPLWALPATFLIDQNWQVRKAWMGALPAKQAQLRTLIERLLADAGD